MTYLSLRIIFITTIVISLISCNKTKECSIVQKNGIICYKNINSKKVKKYFSKISEIHLKFDVKTITDLLSLNNNKYVLLDGLNCRLYFFDANGISYNQCGNKGNGPGEFKKPVNIALKNDTLIVSDIYRQSISKFTTKGDFIEEKIIGKMVNKIIPFSNKYLFSVVYTRSNDNNFNIIKELGIYDSIFNKIKTIYSIEKKWNPQNFNQFDFNLDYTISKSSKEIAFFENSENFYKINICDFTGKEIKEISRPFKKIPFNEKELKLINLKNKKNRLVDTRTKYKKSIIKLNFDSYGKLWVKPSQFYSVKCDSIYDIYEKGKLIYKQIVSEKNVEKIIYLSKKLVAVKENNTLIIYGKIE